MVPKVNSGANVYGVLQYNRIKVEAGEGRILYMQGIDGRFSIEECAEAFGYYTALNPRVRKPVVHFSLNPSPEDRLSEAQLTRLAAVFMERMGYGRQPYVVFLHEGNRPGAILPVLFARRRLRAHAGRTRVPIPCKPPWRAAVRCCGRSSGPARPPALRRRACVAVRCLRAERRHRAGDRIPCVP